MERLNDELLLKLTSSVFELMLETSVKQIPEDDHSAKQTDYIATIHMSGSVNLQLQLCAPEETAKDIAATMFQESPSDLSEKDVQDALGEISNIVAGNLKRLRCRDSELSLPHVSRRGRSISQKWPTQASVLVGGRPLHLAWQSVSEFPCASSNNVINPTDSRKVR